MYKYLFILIVFIWTTFNINLAGDKNWNNVLKYDSRGYYAYLPAIFIYKDLHFGFFEEIEKEKYPSFHGYDYRQQVEGGVVNKYFCGTAVMEIPFFILGHLHAKISSHSPDGFSKPYIIWITFGAIFYYIVALLLLERILKVFQVNFKNRSIIVLALTFGTNAYLYSAIDPGMSHVYSFFLITFFIERLLQWKKNRSNINILYLGVSLGLITIVRPINLMIIASIPFVLGDKKTMVLFLNSMWENKVKTIVSLLLFISIVFIQLLLYKIQTGNFLVYSYVGEGFNFLNPHVFDFLWSYRKGYYLYTPLAFLALLGLIPMFKKSKFQALVYLLFLGFIYWILSSWYMWYYGGSFSSRVMFDFATIIMIPLALLLENSKNKSSYKLLIALIIILVIICQIQLYQFRHFDIHWSDMTKEMYWENFLRIDKYFK